MSRTMTVFLLLVGLVGAGAVAANRAPVVSNVQARQRAGTLLVDITYDVFDADGDAIRMDGLVPWEGLLRKEKAIELIGPESFDPIEGSWKVPDVDRHQVIRLGGEGALQNAVIRDVGTDIEGKRGMDKVANPLDARQDLSHGFRRKGGRISERKAGEHCLILVENRRGVEKRKLLSPGVSKGSFYDGGGRISQQVEHKDVRIEDDPHTLPSGREMGFFTGGFLG